jgi:5-methyltetrahydrofolate--homocysteine methyltransferase
MDGAMGTMIQRHALERGGFSRHALRRLAHRPARQQRSAVDHPAADHRGIHREYLEAGADVISTNTFNSTSVSQADYRMEALAVS